MVSSRILNNDDEYIDGLLDSSPAIVDAIYRRFANKVKHMVTEWGGTMREAARIFEEALLDIYIYAHHQQLTLTNRFEPFLIYACQLKWKQEMTRKLPNKAGSFVPDAGSKGLDAQHIQYIKDALAQGEKRRYWLHRFQQLDTACQTHIRKALRIPAPDGGTPQIPPGTEPDPALFAACMGMLISYNGGIPQLPSADYETINRYVVTGMPEAEKTKFEEQISASPTLQSNTSSYKEAVAGLRMALEPDNTRAELQEVIADQREKWFPTRDASSARVGLYVALIAVMAAAVAGLLFLSPWRKDIYRQFSGTEMIHAHRHNHESDTALLLHEAAANFNRRYFDRAIYLLNQVLERDSTNAYARYYRGVCLVDEGRQTEARSDLLKVYEGQSPYRYDAAFYIALSFLRERNKQQCLEWLLKIPENAPVYWKAAKLREEISEK